MTSVKFIQGKHSEFIFPNEIRYLETFEGLYIGNGQADKTYRLQVNGEVTIDFDTEEERKKAINLLTGV